MIGYFLRGKFCERATKRQEKGNQKAGKGQPKGRKRATKRQEKLRLVSFI